MGVNTTPEYLPFHPISEIFPLLQGNDFDEFAKDIAENGLTQPILTYQGQIIDGRNRYRACRKVGVKPQLVEWHGAESDLTSFALSLNLHRRHLNESQRAMVAAKLANMVAGGKEANLANLPSSNLLISQPKAAEMLNISHRSLRDAKTVQEQGTPELIKSVENGKVSVSAAATVVREIAKIESPEDRAEILQLVSEQSSEVHGRITSKLVKDAVSDYTRFQRVASESIDGRDRQAEIPNVLARSQTQKQMPDDALWVWGQLTDFEDEGIMEKDINSIVANMSDTSKRDVYRIAPKLRAWLEALK